jgi:hypothetical protein
MRLTGLVVVGCFGGGAEANGETVKGAKVAQPEEEDEEEELRKLQAEMAM